MAANLLNEQQKKAVEHQGGPLLVIAGPGSGKTRVIVERVKHLIASGRAKPSEILCLTFSDKAAGEMRTRIEKDAATSEVETLTFHSFCLRVLEESVLETGVAFNSGLISRASQIVWGLRNIDNFGFEHIEIGNNAPAVIEALIDGISAFRDELVTPGQLKEFVVRRTRELADQIAVGQVKVEDRPKTSARKKRGDHSEQLSDQLDFVNSLSDLCKVYERYEKYKRQEFLIDFDDMLQIVIGTFTQKPAVVGRYQRRYAHVLVDEFQDNNYAQLQLLKLLCPQGNLTAVGDDDQSIYRFRGAYSTIFDDLQNHFKDTISIVKLERNYRSTKNIVALAGSLMDGVQARIRKNLYSENEDGFRSVVATCSTDLAEVDFVVGRIKKELQGGSAGRGTPQVSYGDIAILSRKRADGAKFARALRAQGIPCTYAGESAIFSSPVIRDVLAYLQAASDPVDSGMELARIMFSHGVPEQEVKAINHEAKTRLRELVKRKEKETFGSRSEETDETQNYGTDFVYEVMAEVANGANGDYPMLRNRAIVADVFKQISRMVEMRDKKSVSEFVYDVIMHHTDIYKRALQRQTENGSAASSERAILDKFFEIVREFESISRQATISELLDHFEFMRRLEIDFENIHQNNAIDSVTITTVHKSKGREFPIVFVVDLAERHFPVDFRDKRYYCPSELAHGIKDRERIDEKEIFLEEERRLLHVAVTRARHRLFITHAEIYGQNTTKSRPSRFLADLDIENNPAIERVFHDADVSTQVLIAAADDRLEQLKQEFQALAVKFVSQMQLKSALEKIIELAMVEHVRNKKPLEQFDAQAILSEIVADKKELLERLRDDRNQSLLDPDTIHFSASSLKTYQECPMQYKFKYVLEIPSAPKAYFDLGSAVHSAAEVLSRWQIEDKNYAPTKRDAVDILDRFWVSNNFASSKQEQESREHAERMLGFFVDWCLERKASGCTPLEAEKKFEVELAGRKVIGYIDRIDAVRAGSSTAFEVFDYKTGNSTLSQSKARDDIQMNLYSLAVQKLFNQLPRSANLLYLKKENSVSYEVTPASVAKAREEIEHLIFEIMAEKFDPRPSYGTCMMCDYRGICEAKETEE